MQKQIKKEHIVIQLNLTEYEVMLIKEVLLKVEPKLRGFPQNATQYILKAIYDANISRSPSHLTEEIEEIF
jgi:hypothetical protein